MNPLISVILPVFNGQTFLKDAIESILHQSYTNFELIIINDGSTDNTARIINNFSDNRIKLFTNNKNIGLSKSLNIGIAKAKGKYIARHDADDVSHSDRFLLQIKFLQNNEDYGVVGSRSFIIRNNNIVEGHNHPLENGVIKFFTIFDCYFVHGSIMARSEILKLNKYSELPNHNPPEDFELWSRLLLKTKYHNLKKRLIRYRESSFNISFVNANLIDSRVDELAQKNIKQIDKNINKSSSLKLIHFFRNKFHLLSLFDVFELLFTFTKLKRSFNNLFNPKIEEILQINYFFYKNIILFILKNLKNILKNIFSKSINFLIIINCKLFIFIIKKYYSYHFSKKNKLYLKKNKFIKNKKTLIFWLTSNEATLFKEYNKDSLYTNIYEYFSKNYNVYEIWDDFPVEEAVDAKHIFINHSYLRLELTTFREFLKLLVNFFIFRKSFVTNLFVNQKNSFLFAFEPPAVLPNNYQILNENLYNKIFTYRDDLVANKPHKYVKIFFPNSYRNLLSIKKYNTRKFLCNFSANKISSHPDELYSSRLQAIKFYQNNYPELFDNYGLNWNKSKIKSKGYIKDKLQTLSNYKFSLCFENQKNIEGYISEKIIDCFIAGTVPIYYGASNINKFIPFDAYIDFRNFKNFNELHDFLIGMNETDWKVYIDEANKFIQSKYYKNFLPEHFVNIVGSAI
jgi:glycosyltransferase involved in cell wall biosynthesis